MKDKIIEYRKKIIDTLNKLDLNEIENLAKLFLKTRDNNKTIYVFGNGGSGSTASHMVCDIIKGCSYKKAKKFKIFCLNDNIPTILAYSNDVNYECIFEEQLKNILEKDDLVIAISGSGNSKNIIKAIDYANSKGAFTFGLTGFDGGKLKHLSKASVNANINDMQISEDIHLITLHILYYLLENE
jgi:D-sedoheptulose 7-phosphate isomerase